MSVQQIAIALAEHNDHFLVGQRSGDVPLAGYSEFPGGKVLSGETPQAAAVRECLEETGVVVKPLATLDVVTHSYGHGRLELHFIRCRVVESAVPSNGFRWAPRAELAHLRFPDANAAVVRRLVAREDSQDAVSGERSAASNVHSPSDESATNERNAPKNRAI